MNYYEHHIGDYAAATGHLSLIEDAIYSRLLRRYYLQEQPLPAEIAQVARLCGARAPEEVEAVDVILREFFYLEDDGWHNKRADEEIQRYQSKQAKARASAEARWSKDAKHSDSDCNSDAMRTHCEGNALQTPDTNISTSLRSVESARKRAASIPCPDDVDSQTWADFLALRKAKKAPVTETVLRNARAEASKAAMPLEQFLRIWCARGSQGLQADWLRPNERAGPSVAGANPIPEQKSKTLAAIQKLQAMKNGNVDPQRDSGRAEQVALLGTGEDASFGPH